MSGTLPASSALTILMAFRRYGTCSSGFIILTASMSFLVRTGFDMTGPSFFANSSPMPMPSSGRSMSANMMAASRSKALMGCNVTSQASSGVLHISRKECFSRITMYSFM